MHQVINNAQWHAKVGLPSFYTTCRYMQGVPKKSDTREIILLFFFCVGVVYSGEYNVCDVTLSVYPHRASLKNMPGHGGNRTYDLWNTSPMLVPVQKVPYLYKGPTI